MMKKFYINDEDGMGVVDDYECDLDVVVSLLVGELKMMNWWVVMECIEKNVSVVGVVDKMEKEVKKWLKEEKGLKDNFVKEENYIVSFESCNIMSSEFSVMVVGDKEGIEKFDVVCDENRVVEDDDEEMVRDEEFGDWCGSNMVEVDIVEVGLLDECVKMFGDDEKGMLRDIVDEVKKLKFG